MRCDAPAAEEFHVRPVSLCPQAGTALPSTESDKRDLEPHHNQTLGILSLRTSLVIYDPANSDPGRYLAACPGIAAPKPFRGSLRFRSNSHQVPRETSHTSLLIREIPFLVNKAATATQTNCQILPHPVPDCRAARRMSDQQRQNSPPWIRGRIGFGV
ncbi:hypothetical protein CI102_13050 [Trichoderma harzianum]|uniref:Uncharacterized protein n=1 Tax=Trichoderma harzianum CBS 226.95 TaxID=983964 RepID=A0A2T3ZTI6_TRIHA|nr:hypothetical protein M431DRAFT_513868 [Trichoderma harzianum CBS 226.95]PKK43780.1 hypothetical protein CI102_13050 [Trichoderma harzianum]PTB48121.1 hypothetical protein M431DRAFT_513868 [Trichoderma harzianum CBS 226.95]